MSKTLRNLILCLLSAIVLSFAWPMRGLQIFIFVALIPQLVLFEKFGNEKLKKKKVFLWFFLIFFVWNLLCTWWVANASVAGAAMAIILNAAFQALIVMSAFAIRRKLGIVWGVTAFVLFWISFEFIHYRWELIWPWLNLGNVFAPHPEWVQWYSVTGVLGGSLWVWLVNIGIWLLFRSMFTNQDYLMSKGTYMLLIAFIPLFISLGIDASIDTRDGKPTNVVVVQPNIDAYGEKYSTSPERQMNKFRRLAETKLDSSVELILGPETMVPTGLWQERIGDYTILNNLNAWRKGWPNANLLIGGTTYERYANEDTASSSARFNKQGEFWYDVYNTALFFGASDKPSLYYKSKLVPGVEQIPYDEILLPIRSLSINLGGSSGTLGTQDEPAVFRASKGSLAIAPAICYESVCGEHMANFVKRGANLIAVITNDDWWGDTPGYKQHFEYARLRAIESRRWIVRSANTGISGVIDPLGRTYRKTRYKYDEVFSYTVRQREDVTFYVRFGDWLGRLFVYLSILVILYYTWKRFILNLLT